MEKKGEVVGACFVIELEGLEGRKKLGSVPVFSLLTFPAGEGSAKGIIILLIINNY